LIDQQTHVNVGADEGDTWLLSDEIERHVFLSAHYDDVALSCGGTVARLSRAGAQTIIAVVFAAAPPPHATLTRFAERHHTLWGLAASAATSNAGRQAEERASAALLGAKVVTLPLLDAIYRGDRYERNEELFGQIHPAEGTLPREITNALTRAVGPFHRTRYYVPLGVGRHVDHQLAFLAGRALVGAGADDVWCYPDLPYSLRPDALRVRAAEVAPDLGEERMVATDSVWEHRIEAVMACQSQLPSAFGYVGVEATREAIVAALDRFAGGAVRRHDRFWALTAPSSSSKSCYLGRTH